LSIGQNNKEDIGGGRSRQSLHPTAGCEKPVTWRLHESQKTKSPVAGTGL